MDNEVCESVPHFKFKYVNKNDIMNIKCKNEGIKAQYLIDAMEVVGDKFCNIINMSLMKGIFAEYWKLSTVVPVPKVKNTKKCEEFRPVNMDSKLFDGQGPTDKNK
jgi:hypothetical protein